MTTFFITVFTIYILLLFLLMAGWSMPSRTSNSGHRFYFLSVIIVFRNEQKNLPALIQSLRTLDYPKDRFEVMLVDDHSTDDSVSIATGLISDFPNIKIVLATLTGKKRAITQGVEQSTGDIIVTSDADCELPPGWLKSINTCFQNQPIRMLVGAVRIASGHSFFSKLQAIEFSSLIGTAAATLKLGFPTMCNGANLCYTKESFLEVNGFEGNEHIASGDDEFLMRKLVKAFGARNLKFMDDPGAVVTTSPAFSLKDFFAQRFRWAGKWKHNSNWGTRALAILIFTFQVSWLMAIGLLIFSDLNYTILTLMFVKILIEGIFLFKISAFMKQRFQVSAFLLLQLLYPIYVVIVAVGSNVVPLSWKGRSIPNE